MFPHPPYSFDLTLSDYHLFPKFKTFLAGQKFKSNKEIVQEVNAYFEGLEETLPRKNYKLGEKIISKNKVRCKTQIVL